MVIKNGNVFLDGNIKKCDISFEEKITAIGDTAVSDTAGRDNVKEKSAERKHSISSCLEQEILDAEGLYVFPGFIDIHTHGGGGGDFMDATETAFEHALKFHAENGTTSVVATSVTADPADINRMLEMTRAYKNGIFASVGARVIGAHVEGPYLSKKNKGAQHERYLRVPSKDSYEFLLNAADVIKTVTLSPELDGAKEMTEALTEHGMIVCGGHDDGWYERVLQIMQAGMTHCTHLWCAMSTVHMRNGVRSAGLCEAALLKDQLSVEVIADNHHISPEMVELIYKCKGADRMCLVSDSLRAGGMPKGDARYRLGRESDTDAMEFIVADGVAKLPDGSRFAGSIQPVSQMLRNVVSSTAIPLEQAVKMVTSTPAAIIHETEIGSIKLGNKADFCIMDKELQPVMTIVGGRVVYTKSL